MDFMSSDFMINRFGGFENFMNAFEEQGKRWVAIEKSQKILNSEKGTREEKKKRSDEVLKYYGVREYDFLHYKLFKEFIK